MINVAEQRKSLTEMTFEQKGWKSHVNKWEEICSSKGNSQSRCSVSGTFWACLRTSKKA